MSWAVCVFGFNLEGMIWAVHHELSSRYVSESKSCGSCLHSLWPRPHHSRLCLNDRVVTAVVRFFARGVVAQHGRSLEVSTLKEATSEGAGIERPIHQAHGPPSRVGQRVWGRTAVLQGPVGQAFWESLPASCEDNFQRHASDVLGLTSSWSEIWRALAQKFCLSKLGRAQRVSDINKRMILMRAQHLIH